MTANDSLYAILTVIALSMLLGVAIGAWLLSVFINYLMSRGIMDVFYRGERAEVFRLW